MKLKTIIISMLFIPLVVVSQNKKSKADDLFYGYQYKKAIVAYQNEMLKDSLTNQQKLNLADSYLKMDRFEDAASIYLEVNKNDTIMSVHRFNKMLQSLSKNSDKERVKAFLKTKASKVSSELLENAEFNYQLLEGNTVSQLNSIENVAINSPQGDFSPAFYKDGLLFSSGRPKESKGVNELSGDSFLDIYFGKIDSSGDIVNVENFSKIPDTKYHKATPFYSEWLCTFYYILSNTEDGKMAVGPNGKNALAIGNLQENGKFNFILKDLSTSFYYPFFDEAHDRLYFAADFKDGYGGTDLYYVYTSNGQIMSAPINLGPRINSPGNEISPYIFNGALYFSSDVFYGMGGMDVYKSNILEDGSFTIPVNIGEGINSVEDDFGFIIRKEDQLGYAGYVSSNREGGKGEDDLYKFSMKEVPGLKTFVLQGKAENFKTKAGVANAKVTVFDKDGDVIGEAFANDNGNFRVELPWQEQVIVQVALDGFSIFEETYTEEGMEKIQNTPFKVDLARLDDLLRQRENKTIIRLSKFYFAKGKAKINGEVRTELNKVIAVVKKFPELKLTIENHTDSRGSDGSNLVLSQKRANAMKAYLLANGVKESTILGSRGYGEEKIKNNCKNGEFCLDFLHKQNERTLFVVQ